MQGKYTSEPSFLKSHLAYFFPNCCYALGNTFECVCFFNQHLF